MAPRRAPVPYRSRGDGSDSVAAVNLLGGIEQFLFPFFPHVSFSFYALHILASLSLPFLFFFQYLFLSSLLE